MAKILMPLPSKDYDPTESAVSWRFLKQHGHEFVFATPDANPAKADQRMIDGNGLGLLRPFFIADKNGPRPMPKCGNQRNLYRQIIMHGGIAKSGRFDLPSLARRCT